MRKDRTAVLTATLFVAAYGVLWLTGVTTMRHLIDNLVAAYFLSWGLYAFLSNLPRREICARFVLASLVVVLTWGLAEMIGVIGLLDYRALFAVSDGRLQWQAGYLPDDELLYRHQPHYQQKGIFLRGNIGEALCLPPHPDRVFDLRYDHRGFRNDRDLDRADVVVVGDSYVESPMLPSSELLTQVLADLNGQTVANLGVNGYGPEQELVVLKRYALDLKPKTIVWAFFEGNDLLQVVPEDESEFRADEEWRSGGWLDRLWMKSFMRNALYAARQSIQGCIPNRPAQEFRGVFRDNTGRATELFFWVLPRRLTGEDPARLEKLKAVLTEAYALCQEQGIRFMVAFVPVKHRVHVGLPNFQPSTERMRNVRISDLPQQVRELIRSISPDITYVDLTGPLRAAAGSGALTYLQDDTHWTSEGQKVAGLAIHEALEAERIRTASRE